MRPHIVAKEVTDLLKSVKDNIETAQSKQKKYYDAKHGAGLSFKLNALVPRKDFRRPKRKGGKLDPRWLGPYRISGVLGKGLYSLSHCKDGHIVKRVNGMHPNIFRVCLPYSLEITPPLFAG